KWVTPWRISRRSRRQEPSPLPEPAMRGQPGTGSPFMTKKPTSWPSRANWAASRRCTCSTPPPGGKSLCMNRIRILLERRGDVDFQATAHQQVVQAQEVGRVEQQVAQDGVGLAVHAVQGAQVEAVDQRRVIGAVRHGLL